MKRDGRKYERPWLRRFNLAGQIPLITLIVLCLATALMTDRFMSPLNLTNILVQSSIMAILAIGMTFVIIGGGFDLSVGSIVALAGCIAAIWRWCGSVSSLALSPASLRAWQLDWPMA